MSVDLPGFHAGELMVKARRKLFKMGWKQSRNGSLDCIEKEFDGILVSTIWAGTSLLLSPSKANVQDKNSFEAYVPLDDPSINKAKGELIPIFDGIVARNKKRWSREIEEYEEVNNLKFKRSEKYGV